MSKLIPGIPAPPAKVRGALELDDLLQNTLELIAHVASQDWAALWTVTSTGAMIFRGAWRADAPGLEGLEETTRGALATLGEGCLGRAAAGATPVEWRAGATPEADSRLAEARACGLESGIYLPIGLPGPVGGVLELLGRKTQEPSEELAARLQRATQILADRLSIGWRERGDDLDGLPWNWPGEAYWLSTTLQAAVLDSLPAHIVVLDRRGRILAANRSWREHESAHRPAPPGGWVGAELRPTRGGLAVVPDLFPAEVMTAIQQVLCGERDVVRCQSVRDWGEGARWMRTTVAPLGAAASEGVVIGEIDVTSQVAIEDAYREAHAETERLVAAIPYVLVALDGRLVVQRWNRVAAETFGVDSQSVVGRSLSDLELGWNVTPLLDLASECLETRRTASLDALNVTTADGKDRMFSVVANRVRGDSGDPAELLLIGTDVTERRFLEAQLGQAQKLESIGQLAAGIAHEINTPTQYVGDNVRFVRDGFKQVSELIRNYRSLLEDESVACVASELLVRIRERERLADFDYLSREIPTALDQSMEGLERVSKIVLAMKEFSHPSSDEKVEVDLNRAVESTVTVARNEWKYVAEMTTYFDPDLPPVPCLLGDFNQVVLNIVVNAAQAIEEKLGASPTSKGAITVTTRRDGNWVEVRIADTGNGIPEGHRDKIFDPFFTTKKVGRGTGQGLAIAHSVITRKHGGTIGFESRSGAGTTFVIRLPLRAECSVRKEAA